MQFIRINMMTNLNRHEITHQANKAISNGGGWLIDFKQYSNKSICLFFEISNRDIGKLIQSLSTFKLDETSMQSLYDCQSELNGRVSDIKGTLQITFIHDEPDIKREVPPFEL